MKKLVSVLGILSDRWRVRRRMQLLRLRSIRRLRRLRQRAAGCDRVDQRAELGQPAAQSAKNAQDAAAGAQDSVKRANDAVARLEAEFASSVTK